MALDTTQQMLIEQRVTNEGPNGAVAYALWFFLGLIGAHRFYLGQVATGVIMLLLSITGVGLFITFPWLIVDAFLIPDMMRSRRDLLRHQLATQMLAYGTINGPYAPPSPLVAAYPTTPPYPAAPPPPPASPPIVS
ncbi:MAG TPA: TM2 domain-containing protein [Caulobacteraceae bacterium]|jgi:TM2 domain-containing membrane protein YozV